MNRKCSIEHGARFACPDCCISGKQNLRSNTLVERVRNGVEIRDQLDWIGHIAYLIDVMCDVAMAGTWEPFIRWIATFTGGENHRAFSITMYWIINNDRADVLAELYTLAGVHVVDYIDSYSRKIGPNVCKLMSNGFIHIP